MSLWRTYVNRRLAVGYGLALLGCLGFLSFMFAPEWIGSLAVGQGLLLMASSFSAGALGFVYMWFAIRCSRCGLRLFAYAATRVRTGMPMHWLETLDVCPGCGCEPGGGMDSG
jgi:hypothetical protein